MHDVIKFVKTRDLSVFKEFKKSRPRKEKWIFRQFD